DPVFGQGMSVAALEAKLLDDLLRSHANRADETRLIDLPRTYFRGMDKILDPVWLLTSNEAFKYPATTGDRPFGVGSLLQWYTRQLFQLAATDRAVYDDFIGAMHMIAPSNVLFGPAVVGKALARSIAQLRPKASAPALAP